MSSLINVKLDADLASSQDLLPRLSTEHYVTAFQDFIAWFTATEAGGTKLVICMRVDLGEDIPQWALLTTVAATGVWSMRALRDTVDRDVAVTRQTKHKNWLQRLLSSVVSLLTRRS